MPCKSSPRGLYSYLGGSGSLIDLSAMDMFKRMVNPTQTIRPQIADELFECV